MPPPADGFAARLVLGPALRTQPDRRLVSLVREGYEAAFEEIVRRYGKPLTRYAGAIVGARAEDVTQDAFSKALLALRREGAEIELRPWLFRIVRNTALNDLRDSPPSAEALAEEIAGGGSPAEVLERREELAELMQRLGSLPEPQRAAIVMRELEGLSHEEIAAALGLSGGAARQAIYRARQALREGLGLLLPLPLLRMLIDQGGEAVAAGAGAGAGGAAAASGALGSAGAGVALKAGVVTAVLAGSVGAGVALHNRNHERAGAANPALSEKRDSVQAAVIAPEPALWAGLSSSSSSGGDGERVDDSGHGRDGSSSGDDGARSGHGGSGQTGPQNSFAPPESGSRGRGPRRDHSETGDGHGGTRGPREDHSDEEGRHSGPGRPPRGDDGDGHGGSGSGGDRGGGGHHSGDGSGHAHPTAPAPEEEIREGGSGSGSGSGRDDPESGSESTSGSESGSGSSGSGRGGEELP